MFLNLESIGIKPLEATDETITFLHHYQDTSVTLQEKGYNAKLPWREDHLPLPTNIDITQKKNPFNGASPSEGLTKAQDVQ